MKLRVLRLFAIMAALTLSFAEAADPLTEEEVAEYTDIFNDFDEDGNGVITIEELGAVMEFVGVNSTEAELQDMMNGVDPKYGTIDIHEFLTLVAVITEETRSEEKRRETFVLHDEDANGFLSAAELHSFITDIGDELTVEEADEKIRLTDIDGDGQLNYEEFVSMIS